MNRRSLLRWVISLALISSAFSIFKTKTINVSHDVTIETWGKNYDGVWEYVVSTRDKGVVTLYVNGIVKQIESDSSDIMEIFNDITDHSHYSEARVNL